MRGEDEYGILTRNAELREKYGSYAYRAPVEGRSPPVRARRREPSRLPALEALNIRHDTPRAKRLRIETIVGHVCDAWEITRTALLSRSHGRREARPRFALYWLVSERVGLSMPRIGHLIGHRDHTTIMSGIDRAKGLHALDPDWRARYDRVLAALDGKPGEAP